MNFPSILFPVDLSEQCRQAARHVKALADRFNSEILLLHIVEPPMRWSGFPESEGREAIEGVDLREMAREEFRRFLPGAFNGLTIHRVLAEGDPAQQIACHARKNRTSLIMLPTHGWGTFRGALLGSVTAKVLHDAECPVWTGVHRPEWSMHPPGRWRKILCAVDTLPKDCRTIRAVVDLAASSGAEVQLVHAVGTMPQDCTVYAGEPLERCLLRAATLQLDKLQEQAGTRLEAKVKEGSTATVVRDGAREWNADLVVVGRGAIQKPLGRLRSKAYAIIRESPCPVISI